MAKTSGPLMSMDASGTFGNTLTFAKNRGVPYVRQRVIPRNPRTANQQTARAALAAGGRINHHIEPMSDAQVLLASLAPSNMSWASYFARKVRAKFAAAKTAYETAGNATVKGYFDDAAESMGITGVTIPGTTPLVVPAGLILWAAYDAAYAESDTIAPTTAVTASEANVATFIGNLVYGA